MNVKTRGYGMKARLALLVLAIAACAPAAARPGEAEAGFLAAKDLKDRLYAERNDCARLMGMFSEDVIFWEKGRRLSYDFLVEYCPQLPKDPWQDRKSTRLNPVTNEHLGCSLLLENTKLLTHRPDHHQI